MNRRLTGRLLLSGALTFATIYLLTRGSRPVRRAPSRPFRPERKKGPEDSKDIELAEQLQREWRSGRHDTVEEASWESFPASDAPGWRH